jgi:hypothetical protein
MYGKRENVSLRGDVDGLSAMANETAAAYPDVATTTGEMEPLSQMSRTTIQAMIAHNAVPATTA